MQSLLSSDCAFLYLLNIIRYEKVFADMIGTMVLVLMGCGTVVSLNCGVDTASVIGTAMAFGLAVVSMAYTIGGISDCNINPAITLGAWLVELSQRMLYFI